MGSGFDRDDLDRAGAKQAGALAAVTSGDNSNILTARIARENYGIPNVVARIYDPRRAEIYQRLGIPTVATVTWTIDQVMRRLLPEAVVGEWTDATGPARAGRARPARGVGRARRLRDLGHGGQGQRGGGHPGRRAPARGRRPRRPGGRRVAPGGAQGRHGRARAPLRGGTALPDGRSLRGRAPVKVAIAGAGNVGTAIAKDLAANGHDVLLIERDPDLVERLRSTVDVTWVAADACEVSSLDAAGMAAGRRGRGGHR